MAEVVVEQAGEQASGSVFSGVGSVWQFIQDYWLVLLLIALLIIGTAVIVWLIWWINRENKRKDQMYLLFERTLDACKINRKKNWVWKKRKWWLIPLIGTPIALSAAYVYLFPLRGEHWWIFWMLMILSYVITIPFAWFFYTDKSMRVIDVDQRTVGFYRGHARKQDGYIYLLLRVGKKWVFLDDNLILQLPENVLTFDTKKIKNKEGEVKKEIEFSSVSIDKYIFNERDNYIFIPMVAMVKEDSYYYTPTLVEQGRIIDLRQKIANSIHLQLGIQHVETLYSNLSKVTSNAVDSNVVMSAVKKTPEKERDVKGGEESQER